MNTLEFARDGTGVVRAVVWSNHTPQDVYRRKYSDDKLTKEDKPPISLAVGLSYVQMHKVTDRDDVLKAWLMELP